MSGSKQAANDEQVPGCADFRARVAVDLGAESCRVSLLRWSAGLATIELIHRVPNGPVHVEGSLRWPIESILGSVEEGLRKAAERASEGIASIAVDGWAVDYIRLGTDGTPLQDPFCYRDERTLAAKEAADRQVDPEQMYRRTGAQPLRINTVYQLLADRASGMDPLLPWVNLPEYVLYHLGGKLISEYTNATHTGLVDLESGDWSDDLLHRLHLPRESFPTIVPAGTTIGKLRGALAELPAFRDTDLIAPACHDTASAIAGIASPLEGAAYICSGTWSLVGTRIAQPITTDDALRAGFTNQGAAGEGFCFHKNVNGMWILKQCLKAWRSQGRVLDLTELIDKSNECDTVPGIVNVDAAALLLDGDMPSMINDQLAEEGHARIEDADGNEPVFARVLFESLARRYAETIRDLECTLGHKVERIHVLGGGSLNRLLTRLTAEHCALPVEVGESESSIVGNFAVQLAATARRDAMVSRDAIQQWAEKITRRRHSTRGPD